MHNRCGGLSQNERLRGVVQASATKCDKCMGGGGLKKAQTGVISFIDDRAHHSSRKNALPASYEGLYEIPPHDETHV